VPSLCWWRAASRCPTKGGGKKAAWISTSDEHGSTLVMVADRLSETFTQHGIDLDTGQRIPKNLLNAKLAIVTAHGSVGPDDTKFFQKISDEGSLVAASGEFAKALHSVEVVVLFVCSAGRQDTHPTANTMTGLVKQLLDAGCLAVIGSPWPLDPRVTYHWLPTLLRVWSNGASLMDANFQANLAVDRGFGGDLGKSLAMNLYGYPFIAY
jgi:hypothetical protein